jgi:hypothetical protein
MGIGKKESRSRAQEEEGSFLYFFKLEIGVEIKTVKFSQEEGLKEVTVNGEGKSDCLLK